MFSGLVDGGPLVEGGGASYTGMAWPTDVVTLRIEAGGERQLVLGSQPAPEGGWAVEYGWVWGMWLWGASLAAARTAAAFGI